MLNFFRAGPYFTPIFSHAGGASHTPASARDASISSEIGQDDVFVSSETATTTFTIKSEPLSASPSPPPTPTPLGAQFYCELPTDPRFASAGPLNNVRTLQEELSRIGSEGCIGPEGSVGLRFTDGGELEESHGREVEGDQPSMEANEDVGEAAAIEESRLENDETRIRESIH
ncbi:hypothetical protein BV25DRAFT_1921535 [Artomyces pyxidatus]|uniref:Uncharacterized protein n=1 Tax=Artomyces pyxidatus TaxID=48021 RepID=A0ACB8SJ39_9AGAM|nr:hypothetical protein BV25DRAFT_1921535 [Artomyces pyxidatus]